MTSRRGYVLRRFSNPRGVLSGVPGGVFLRKTPLRVRGFALRQLENRYRAPHGAWEVRGRDVESEGRRPKANGAAARSLVRVRDCGAGMI